MEYFNLSRKQEAFLVLFCYLFYLTLAAPEYQFSFGKISGVDEEAQDSLKPLYAYYGIPFAQSPVGSLRFRAPQPYRGNGPNTAISSTGFRPNCIQPEFEGNNDVMSEDCLHLNVFTPANVNSGGALKKVMVWVHGGGYTVGGAKYYKPTRLVTDYDVIVVTIQYRLGMFGFLNPGSGEANFGLRDQIMAVRWVKDNIGQFGGDGNDITVFGESAGASSIGLMSLSPLAKGLFTKAIMQSGSALNPWATNKATQEQFLKVANKLGCLTWLQQFSLVRERSMGDIMDCLRKKSTDDILKSPNPDDSVNDFDDYKNWKTDEAVIKGIAGFMDTLQAPSVDGVVIPRDPESLLADRVYLEANGVLDRSYIVGFNNNEGLMPVTKRLVNTTVAEKLVKSLASIVFPVSVTDDVMDFVVYEYTYPRGDKEVLDVLNVLNGYNDVVFTVSAVRFARALASMSDTTPVYFYLLDHYPELIDPNGPLKGSAHTLDLIYEFDRDAGLDNMVSFYAKVHTPTDQPMYNIVRNSFTQFAKTGVPSSQEYRSWPRFRVADQSYMALDSSPDVRQRVFAKRMDLWTGFLTKRTSPGFRSRGLRLY